MTLPVFIVLSLLVQASVLCADLVDVYRESKTDPHSNIVLRSRSVLFLIAVIVIYGIIQFGLLSLAPTLVDTIQSAEQMMSSIFATEQRSELPFFSLVLLGIIGFYVAGFWDYVTHRLLHRNGWFVLHEYHHLPNKIFLALPGFSVRPYVLFASIPAIIMTLYTLFLGLSFFGYAAIDIMPVLYVVVFVQTVILVCTHSSVFLKLAWVHGPLHAIAITTPQEHALHHTVDLRGNYGNFTTLWDRIFGTYLDPLLSTNQGHRLGLGYDQDYLGVLTGGRMKLSYAIRKYFQIDRYCNIDTVEK